MNSVNFIKLKINKIFTQQPFHMKLITSQSINSSHKRNPRFITGSVSPQPSRIQKATSNKSKSMREIFTVQQSNTCSSKDGREVTHFFQTEDGQILKYCQKCSIMLASKGFNVQKLPIIQQISTGSKQKSTQKSNCSTTMRNTCQKNLICQKGRLNILKDLKHRISFNQEELQSMINKIQAKLIQSAEKYSEGIEQISSYFKIIQQLIEYQKYLAYNRVLADRVDNEKTIKQYKDQLQAKVDELQNITNDLIQNQDVAATVNDYQFNSIIQNYHDIVRSVPKFISSYPVTQHFQCLTFPKIPQIIQKLADSIILEKQLNQSQSHLDQQIKINSAIYESSKQNLDTNYERSPISQFKQRYIDLNQQNNESFNQKVSCAVSQNSFSKKNNFQRSNFLINEQQVCHKEIMLKNSFSLASSIKNEERQSFEEEYNRQDDINSDIQEKGSIVNFSKNDTSKLPSEYINYMNESLGQYLGIEDTLIFNQTQQERSQTLLLNH